MAGIFSEFKKFMREFNVITVAVGFVVGTAVRDYVRSFVDFLIMPVINTLAPGLNWEDWVLTSTTAQIKIGALLAASIDFLFVIMVIFIFSKMAKSYAKS